MAEDSVDDYNINIVRNEGLEEINKSIKDILHKLDTEAPQVLKIFSSSDL
jgi:hypothetical protein